MSKWKRTGEWSMEHGPWRIAKSLVGGKPRYTLTHEARWTRWCGIRMHAVLGVFETASEAMEAAQ